jgi:hypothetical protein
MSRRQQRKLRRQARWQRLPAAASGRAVQPAGGPRFDGRTAFAQFVARAAMEARYILKSPVFLILLLIAFLFTLPGLLTASGFLGGGALSAHLVPCRSSRASTRS